MPTQTLTARTRSFALLVVAALLSGAGAIIVPAQQPQQETVLELVIGGDAGAPPRFAVPDFVPLTPESAEIAKVVTQVLWDDLNFEREFYLIPRDTYTTVPQARSADQLAFASWRELGADGVIFGTVQRTGDKVVVQVRLLNVRTRQAVFSKEYTGTASNPRLYAHTAADEIHLQQRALKGVARSKLAFASDRTRVRADGPVANRETKEIYVSDYDGGNQQRITNTRQLNSYPSWSADGRAVAYTSYRRIVPDIFISRIYEGILENPLKGRMDSTYLPVYSQDGTRIAFMSNRDGNPEIYVMNVNGSNVRRLTNHPAGESSPTWSPTGTQIAFTSDRAGQPQVYVMSSVDGTGLRKLSSEPYADRPTWAPSGLNEVAFTAGPSVGPYNIKVLDLATGAVRQITTGPGSHESPAYSPSGRHLAFTTTRGGRTQVFIIGRDGRGQRQVTTDGNNFSPAWSK